MIHYYLKDRLINDFFYKDVFCVPVELSRQLQKNVELHFIGSDSDLVNPYLDKSNVRVVIHSSYLGMIFSFLRNIRKISVLGLFHIYKHSIFFSFLFKKLNKLGKVYIKGDFNYESLKNLVVLYEKYSQLITYFLSFLDIVSFENKELFDYFKTNISTNNKTKLLLVKNALYLSEESNVFNPDKKEKIILIVGRFYYDKIKNYSFLFQVIKSIQYKLKNWKIICIGDTSGKFDGEYLDFIDKYKSLLSDMSNVDFLGSILDRRALYEYFNKSNIFCISSLSEGDPLVQYEAMYFGNYLVSTDVGTIKGNYFPDSLAISDVGDFEAYKSNLEQAIDYFESADQSEIYRLQNQTHEFCKKNYSWTANLKELATYLK